MYYDERGVKDPKQDYNFSTMYAKDHPERKYVSGYRCIYHQYNVITYSSPSLKAKELLNLRD